MWGSGWEATRTVAALSGCTQMPPPPSVSRSLRGRTRSTTRMLSLLSAQPSASAAAAAAALSCAVLGGGWLKREGCEGVRPVVGATLPGRTSRGPAGVRCRLGSRCSRLGAGEALPST